MARTLYHFPTSPFSRRVRLALAHKGLDVELRDARASLSDLAVARAAWPLRTIPVLVDGDHAIGDSTAITRWLDAAYPDRPIWPTERDAASATLATCSLVDGFLDTVIDVATRYYPLRDSSAWRDVAGEMLGRAEGAAARLAERASDAQGWGAREMWLYTMVAWWEGLPARAGTGNKNVDQLLSLGVTLPPALGAWAARYAERPDVRALA